MQSQTPQEAQDFFSVLQMREAQARAFGERHLVAVPGTDSMLYWLAEACMRARKAGGRRQVHVAASIAKGADQSTIARFEKHTAWPRDADAVVRAYADDLEVSQLDLWDAALRLWREHEAGLAEKRVARAARRSAQR